MADLPVDRLESALPFICCGVGFCRTILYQGKFKKGLKRYGVIFICMSCREIHKHPWIRIRLLTFCVGFLLYVVQYANSDQIEILTLLVKKKAHWCFWKRYNIRISDFLLKQVWDFRLKLKYSTLIASHMDGVWKRHNGSGSQLRYYSWN